MKSFRTLTVWALAMSVAACATTEAAKEPTTVLVPLPVPCISTMPTKPPWATLDPALPTDIYSRLVAALKELGQRRAYEQELEAVLQGCN